MHLDGFGEANTFPHQPFDPGAKREVFAFQLLCPPLADDMLVWCQVPMIGTPAVCVIAANTEGFEQGFEFQQCLVLPATKDVR